MQGEFDNNNEQIEACKQAVADKFPNLEIVSFEYEAQGWDSLVYRVNDEYIFRFPKRSDVEQNLRREIILLQNLQAILPLPIPNPVFATFSPAASYPYIFMGYKKINGISLGQSNLVPGQESWWHFQLGDFLSILHEYPIDTAKTLGVQEKTFTGLDEISSDWQSNLEAFYLAVKTLVCPLLTCKQQSLVKREFEKFLLDGNNFSFKKCFLHSDLHDEHIILDVESRKIAGIIDFGDCAIGDPAYDVGIEVAPYYRGNLGYNWQNRRKFYKRIKVFSSIIFGITQCNLFLFKKGLEELEQQWFSL